MDFLRRIEEDIKNLGNEVKRLTKNQSKYLYSYQIYVRKYPEVKEASDKGLSTLKSMRGITSLINKV